MNLLHNIFGSYTNLRNDFTGFAIYPSGILHFFLDIIIVLGVFMLFYFIGDIVRRFFFQSNKQYLFFINIALGCITIGTGIAILGIVSLLYPLLLSVYLLIVSFIVLTYLFFTKRKNLKVFIKKLRKKFSFDKIFVLFGVVLFIFIAFLRLTVPETGEDSYHTDLPRLYLTSHTTIIPSRELLHSIPYPQLAEMTYLIPIFLGEKNADRFIHFGFYLLIILLLFEVGKNKKYSFTKFAPLLFVTAPVVIRYSSSSYIDFFMIFFFVLAFLFITKKPNRKDVVLSGIFLGGAFATKLWPIIYLPALAAYLFFLNKHMKVTQIVKLVSILTLACLTVGFLWLLRDYMITGNPIYPFFSKIVLLETNQPPGSNITTFFGLNLGMFAPENMAVYSPLFFLSIIFCLFYFSRFFKQVRRFSLLIFVLILTCEQLFIKIYLGRHLLAWYTASIFVVSTGLFIAFQRSPLIRYGVILLYFIIFSYYFLMTLLALPYGLGWADQNKYLTRILSRDNASYYDFDHLFDKWITKNDLVATYGISNFYYANFSYIDIGYVFSSDQRSFALLKKRHVTKLFIKGGDIYWFCKTISLQNCRPDKVKLLAVYPPPSKKYNLYLLEW